jgi:hypothetical protein
MAALLEVGAEQDRAVDRRRRDWALDDIIAQVSRGGRYEESLDGVVQDEQIISSERQEGDT